MATSADALRRGALRALFAISPRDLPFTFAVFVLALLPRLYVAIAWAREPVWDGHYYDFGARRIASGFGYSDDIVIGGQAVWHPWCHYPVGYSGFLAIAYRLFGTGPHVATVANAVTGALLVAVVHRLARYGLSPVRARVAALLAALSPGLIVYAALLMTEPLAALGTLLSAWLLVRMESPPAPGEAPRALSRHPLVAAIASGVALGLSALVRPQSLACAPALALLALGKAAGKAAPGEGTRRLARAVGAAAIATATAFAVIAPWTARNCRVMDGCALVSTNAGWNLAIGAFPRATGRFETLKASDGCHVVTGQVQQDRCWLSAGLRWIKDDPRRWLALMPQKLAFTFDHESFPMGYLGEADPQSWPEERKAQGRALLSTAHRALMGLAALGLVALPLHRSFRDRLAQIALLALGLALGALALLSDIHPTWPLALFIPLAALLPVPGRPQYGGVIGYLAFVVASVAATHAVFFGEDRYHMVATPALCILAAAALRRPDAPAARVTESQGNPGAGD